MAEMSSAYKVLVGKTEGRRSLGKSRRKREDNVKKDIKEVAWKSVDWI
jgi:hypothetical protein